MKYGNKMQVSNFINDLKPVKSWRTEPKITLDILCSITRCIRFFKFTLLSDPEMWVEFWQGSIIWHNTGLLVSLSQAHCNLFMSFTGFLTLK